MAPFASNIDVVMTEALREKANRLAVAGKPFALATVVRSEAPTSARPGAKAIVTADGDIEGWIGGGCAQPAVIKVAKQVLQDGRPRLIRISPDKDLPADPGILDFGMSCESGGTLDIFIEAVTARPTLLVIGQSPVAQALCSIAPRVGFSVTVAFPDADRQVFPEADRIEQSLDNLRIPADVAAYVVVATQGRRDEEGLEAALASGATYVAFVASARKAATLKQYLKERGHAPARVDAIVAPAGVDIGAVTPEEIALSVLGGVVQARRASAAGVKPAAPTATASPAAEAIDPVCGMTVSTRGAEYQSEYNGKKYYFCCAHCQHSFEKDPQKYFRAVAG
jgi:xanthine dehydrogenase accessory factor